MANLTREKIIGFGYNDARQLPDGTWIALGQSIFTVDLYYGMDESGWSRKWMYPNSVSHDATIAFYMWGGEGDPPGRWVKHKGDGGEYSNPRFSDGGDGES